MVTGLSVLYVGGAETRSVSCNPQYIICTFCCRQNHAPLYLKTDSDDEGSEELDPRKVGTHSCVTMFVKMLLSLVRKMLFENMFQGVK
jgi:hypothetical protein